MALNVLHFWKKEKNKYCITKNNLQCSLQNSLRNSLQYRQQYSLEYSLQYSLQYSQIMSMTLAYLLSLQLVFVYFLLITFSSLKQKPMKNKINHQNKLMCFRTYIIIEWLWFRKTLKNLSPTVDDVKKPIGDGPLTATVVATTAVIFFGLWVVGVRQDNALLTSMSLLYLLYFFDLMI